MAAPAQLYFTGLRLVQRVERTAYLENTLVQNQHLELIT